MSKEKKEKDNIALYRWGKPEPICSPYPQPFGDKRKVRLKYPKPEYIDPLDNPITLGEIFRFYDD
jgi:hypothetical protein